MLLPLVGLCIDTPSERLPYFHEDTASSMLDVEEAWKIQECCFAAVVACIRCIFQIVNSFYAYHRNMIPVEP